MILVQELNKGFNPAPIVTILPFFLYQYSAEAGLVSHKSVGAAMTSCPVVWTLSSTLTMYKNIYVALGKSQCDLVFWVPHLIDIW